MNGDKCGVCKAHLVFRWTDLHGVGECSNCGATYQIYHYENDRPVDRPPELLLKDEYVPLLREYIAHGGRNPRLGTYLGRHPDPEAYKAFLAFLDAREPVEVVS